MGSLNNGLFGGFSGRVGNLVGYMLYGKSVVRTIGHSSKPLTPARMANCERMTVVNNFLKADLDFIRIGFREEVLGTNKNFYNAAVAYNKRYAIQGEYPNISMDYSKAMLSKGDLLKADQPTVLETAAGIEFNWEVPADLGNEHKYDRAMLIVYFPDKGVSRSMLSGARRQEGKDTLMISSYLAGQRLEAYISFISMDGTRVSDSVYVGALNTNTSKNRNTSSALEEDIPEDFQTQNTKTDQVVLNKDKFGKTNQGKPATNQKKTTIKQGKTARSKKLNQQLDPSGSFSRNHSLPKPS